MRKLMMGAALGFAFLSPVACSSVTEPVPVRIEAPDAAQHTEVPDANGNCRSGYSVATGRDGELICVADQ